MEMLNLPKTVLLTGAAGFIGSRTAELLLKQGVKVIGVDNMNTYYDVRLKDYRLETLRTYKNFEFYERDISDLRALEYIFQDHKIDAVINLAARAGVRYSIEDPHVYLSTNTEGTLNLLQMMKKHEIKKMVLASTSSLYAGLPMPFVETAPVNTPISPYAATKKGAELMAHSYHALFGLDISVIRYFTVFGEAGRPDMSIFRFIKWIAEGTPMTIFGDGSQSRDFTYVEDIALGTIAALKPVGYEIFNLGGGEQPVSLNYIIEKIENLLGKKSMRETKPFHKADITATWANIEKAEKMLGWKPKTSVEEGLEKCVKWYLNNESWLKEISCEEGE